jgi:hypothetical protein
MKTSTILIGACASLIALPAAAHHSFSMFDNQKTITLTGVVKQLEWTNPHCWLDIVVEENGKEIEYPLEMQGTGQSMKNGWTPDTVKPGDRISADIHPLKAVGSHGGQLLAVVLPDGRKIAVTGRPASPFGEN